MMLINKNKEWTTDEVRTVVEIMTKATTPGKGFKQASKAIGRTTDAISHRWYSEIKPERNKIFDKEEAVVDVKESNYFTIAELAFDAMSKHEKQEFLVMKMLELTE